MSWEINRLGPYYFVKGVTDWYGDPVHFLHKQDALLVRDDIKTMEITSNKYHKCKLTYHDLKYAICKGENSYSRVLVDKSGDILRFTENEADMAVKILNKTKPLTKKQEKWLVKKDVVPERFYGFGSSYNIP